MSKTNAGKFQGRPLVPLIVVQDADCGPAMLALSPPQRAFVIAKVRHGDNNTEAAKRAGYSGGCHDGAKSTGYVLAHREDIVAAIIEESKKVLKSEGPNSVRTLVTLRDDPKVEPRDRIKAAIELMNRGGLSVVNESHVLVEHQLSEVEKDRRILALAAELGLPQVEAQKLLIDPKRIVDAEFSEVPAEPTAEDAARQEERDRENKRRRKLRAAAPEDRERLKAEARAQRTAELKARYAAAQGRQSDLEEYLSGQDDDISDLLGPAP